MALPDFFFIFICFSIFSRGCWCIIKRHMSNFIAESTTVKGSDISTTRAWETNHTNSDDSEDLEEAIVAMEKSAEMVAYQNLIQFTGDVINDAKHNVYAKEIELVLNARLRLDHQRMRRKFVIDRPLCDRIKMEKEKGILCSLK